ncbi:hypothetical protein QZH41_003790 [Actinostola sp. cb2023]|nr:hypothetical protein QZH41_003790 [Actinostola sp. cb2023]
MDIAKEDISTLDGLKLLGWEAKTNAQTALEYLFTNYENGRNPENTSFTGFFVPENEFFITDPRGVMFLYKELYGKFASKIKLNKKVVNIVYNSGGVEVITSDGEVYTADYVLCTFSTGVLASDMVKFTPPLPEWKQEAILKMPMTVYTKIFLKFPDKFWDNKEYILLAGHRRGFFPVFQAPFSGYNVEKGANWIQDAKDEETAPIWKLKQAKTMRGIYSDYYDMIISELKTNLSFERNETGANVTGMASDKEFEKMFSTAKQKIEELTKKNPTISARAGLSLLGWNPHTPAQYAIEFYNIDFEYGKKAELIPISSLSEIGMTSGEDFFVTDERGMWTLYEDLYKGFDSKIKLNKTVTGIKYNSSGVEGEMANYKIEKGANWIHFAKEAETVPIWKLKQARNMRGIYSDYTDMIIRNETGANVTDMASYHKIQKLFETVEDEQDERKEKKKSPISARVGLSLLGWKPKTAAQYVLEYLEVDFENSKQAELVPFSGLFEKGTDFLVTDSRGFWTLFQDLYKGFEEKIKLNKTVTGIKYNSSFVEVTTRDGEVYTADYVLCTFSTGVLASDMVKFTPPLPEWKQEAILKMPMSVYTKIFLKFPNKFWDNKEYILLAGHRRSFFPVFQDLERPGIFPNGSGMLMITVTGDEGRRIEKQSFQETKTEIVKMLRGVYGQNVSEPTDIFYERWSLNPYIRGAYSEGTVGVSSKDITNLGKNLGSLYFSGEAINEEWYGYLQGAYMTGEETAKAITKAIKCKDTGEGCPKDGSSMMLNPSINIVFAVALVWLVCYRGRLGSLENFSTQ